MPSTYSPNLRIELIASGEQANTWGNTTNTNLGTLIEQAIAGLSSIDVTAGNVTLTAYNGASDQSRQMILNVTGTPGVARTLTAPSVSKVYVIANNSDADVTIETATGTGVAVSSGYSKFVFCDGTDFSDVTTETTVLAVEDLIVNGDATLGDALTDVITINGTVQPGVVISGSSSSAALRITQTGAGNALVVEDSANPDATPFVVDASGNVSVGGNLNVPGLTASRALATDASKNLVSSTATSTELGYLSGVTSAIQTQINSKVTNSFTASRALVSDGSGLVSVSTVTSTELGYLSGVTSAIQTQLNSKAGTATANTFTNNQIISVNSSSDALRITQTGAGNALLVEDSANPDSTPFVIDADGRVGVGSTPGASTTIQITKALTGGAAAYGILLQPTIQSDVVSNAFGFITAMSTQAASFALGSVRHFQAQQGSIGAGSAVTSQFGFLADSSLTGATNNYGFYSNIASGSGRYNFYAAGTADNYFAGAVGIGTTSLAGFNIYSNRALTGATIAASFQTAGPVQSDVTTEARSYASFLQTSGATFSLGTATHYHAQQGSFTSATVTNQIGFRADASLTGATNNFGFYSNIASGSGRYNFYAAGTADNYFAGKVGIGTTIIGGYYGTLTVGGFGSPTAGYLQGIHSDMAISSSVTTRHDAFLSSAYTQAASFTLSTLRHYAAQLGGIGAGSAITNQMGFAADSSLTGATNNFGFYSNIASGSGRFNFYAAGTADNYFAGNVGIGQTPTTGVNLDITKANSGAAVTLSVSARINPDATVSSEARGFGTFAISQAGSTTPSITHFHANQGSFSGTHTNQYGFYTESTLTGATNNYGFYSNIASGSGRYNFYAAGTASNYFAGNVKTEGTLAGGYSALSAGTTAMGLASDKVVKVTPNATATFTTTVAPAGATASIIIVTSGTTSYTITFGTGFLTTGTLATGTVTAKTFVVNFVSDGTTMIETSRTVAM